METQNEAYTGFKGEPPVQTVNPDSGNQGGSNTNTTSPNAASENKDDGIINNTRPPADQGGRNTDPSVDLASRNRLNASGLGGV
jgi:hypothetical protein